MSIPIRELLSRLRSQSGCELAAAVGTDGLLIESAARQGLDAEAIGAVAANGLAMTEALGREINKGGAKQAILEYQQGLVVIEPITDEVMLLLVTSSREMLGRLRFFIDLHREAVAEALRANTSTPA